MTSLSANERAYIRPAPTSGNLGGLAMYSHDVIALCQLQYPLVLVETVGIGQSEIHARQAVDMLILAVPPAGGDSLQVWLNVPYREKDRSL
jgi:LAO/AO transport system kinase